MRLKPPVSVEEAHAWLKDQAVVTWGIEMTPELEEVLLPTAESMAALGAMDIPDDVEPLLL